MSFSLARAAAGKSPASFAARAWANRFCSSSISGTDGPATRSRGEGRAAFGLVASGSCCAAETLEFASMVIPSAQDRYIENSHKVRLTGSSREGIKGVISDRSSKNTRRHGNHSRSEGRLVSWCDVSALHCTHWISCVSFDWESSACDTRFRLG